METLTPTIPTRIHCFAPPCGCQEGLAFRLCRTASTQVMPRAAAERLGFLPSPQGADCKHMRTGSTTSWFAYSKWTPSVGRIQPDLEYGFWPGIRYATHEPWTAVPLLVNGLPRTVIDSLQTQVCQSAAAATVLVESFLRRAWTFALGTIHGADNTTVSSPALGVYQSDYRFAHLPVRNRS